MKNFFIGTLLLALLGGGGYFTWKKVQEENSGDKVERQRTAEVKLATIEDVVEASGVVEPVVSTDVRSEISGKIIRILVDDGDLVEAGQPLVELDQTSLETDLREAQRNYQGQLLRVEKAERDYLRLAQLYESNYAQERDVLDAETDLELAKIELEVRKARLDKAQENLSKTTIPAPQAGTVAKLNVNEGQVIIGATSVNQGTSLMTIHNLDSLYVETDINELDIAKLTEGGQVKVTFDALPDQTFEGEVSQIYSYAREERNQRVFTVRITFDARDANVRTGISANLTFPIEKKEDVPALLISAVYTEGESKYVYKINGTEKDGSPVMDKITVETGLSDAQNVEILSGLEVGDTVSLVRPGLES